VIRCTQEEVKLEDYTKDFEDARDLIEYLEKFDLS
jgi:hypothetical protein